MYFKIKNIIPYILILSLFFQSCDDILVYNKEELVIVNEDSITGFKYNDKLYSGYYERYYDELGLKKIKEKDYFFNGIRNKDWEYYYKNGILKQKGRYINGIKEGE